MDKGSKTTITEKGYHTFLEISVYLTGFEKNELLATGMHETYYYTIMKDRDQDTVRIFFEEAQAIMDKNAGNEKKLLEQIKLRLLPKELYNEMARKIILLWYTGMWAEKMISAESYVEGLIWAAAKTHPAGARQPGFASWSYPPL